MKRILLCLFALSAMIGATACQVQLSDSENMNAYEFLCEFASPARRLKADSGQWYYLRDNGNAVIFEAMDDIQQNRVETSVSFQLQQLENAEDKIYLRYCLSNGMDNVLEPFGRVEIAALLKDGWYIMPNLAKGEENLVLESGESLESRICIGTLQKSGLPDGRYRLQLKIDDLSYAFVEFKIENTAGEINLYA